MYQAPGRCGEGSPCEQLCRELHDGTYECGCGPGYVLQVDGYGCLELNSTKSTDTEEEEEDVLYQKDVSFSAELEIAPSNRINKPNLSVKHIDEAKRLTTALPIVSKTPNYTYTGEKYKRVDGLRSLIEDGVSKMDLNIIEDEIKDGYVESGSEKVTTLGPSLEQKVPGATASPPWTAAVEACDCETCSEDRCTCAGNTCKPGTYGT
ncbi:unnamed protein product [Arctia plantaginis]|uniref:EGF-like domain-containing protein n=1 Tax=Arctia plantaginis TaxID=874455 RepID=A0A8S0Z2S4_ARCPL|nr:unnamed protein product [Arctia plantaginis]